MSIQVTRSSMPPFEEYCEEIKDLWTSRWLSNAGTKHQQLRLALAEYLDVAGAGIELLTNGHMALELSLQTLKLQGEVITTPFTFSSTTQAIVRNGLAPVFCDIDSVSFTIDPAKIEPLISEKTSAIMPVHTYGNICAVEEIERIAKKYRLKVLYDAAHAFGVRYKGKGIGNYGDVSCFSFHATKVFHTVEGGAACFREEAFGRQLAELRNFGLNAQGLAEEAGTNAKMDEFRAAMGLCNLRYVDREIARRKVIVERYRSHLEGVSGIQLAPIQDGVQSNYAYFPAVFDAESFGANRDEVLAALEKQDIMARKYFYPLTSLFPCYGGRYGSAPTPVALRISRDVLALPLYADMTLAMTDRICEIVLACRK